MPMNNLFLYRLALVAGKMALLLINLVQPIWSVVHPLLWVILGGYCLLILAGQSWPISPLNQVHQSRWMLLVDLLVWGAFFAALQGVTNPLIWCLLIPAVLSALSQGVSFTWFIAVLANALYGVLWWLSPHLIEHSDQGAMMQQHITGMWLGFMAVSVLLNWVTTTLMQRLAAKIRALLQYEKP